MLKGLDTLLMKEMSLNISDFLLVVTLSKIFD